MELGIFPGGGMRRGFFCALYFYPAIECPCTSVLGFYGHSDEGRFNLPGHLDMGV